MSYDQNGINLETDNKDIWKIPQIFRISSDICKLNHTYINNPQVKKEVIKEILKYLAQNKYGNTLYVNLWDAAKAVLQGNFWH